MNCCTNTYTCTYNMHHNTHAYKTNIHMCENAYHHTYTSHIAHLHYHSIYIYTYHVHVYLNTHMCEYIRSWVVYFLSVIEPSGVKDLYFRQPCKYHFSFHNPGLWFIFMVTKFFNKLKQISLTQAKRKWTQLPKYPFCHCESTLLGTLPQVLVSSESKTRKRRSADLQPKVLSLT